MVLLVVQCRQLEAWTELTGWRLSSRTARRLEADHVVIPWFNMHAALYEIGGDGRTA